MSTMKKVVLAYSGGLDTSIILKWLQVEMGLEVVTLTADLGQDEDLSGVEAKAMATGAVKAYVEDLREEFARDFIFPMMRSGAVYEGRYLLGTSIARPLIAKRLVDIAKAEGAQAISHGATGKGNDQVRFELAAAALAPELKVIAPWRMWDMKSRTDLNDFAEKNGIPVVQGAQKAYSMDRNMLHASFEGGELESPGNAPGPHCYAMAVPIEQAPDKAEVITLEFEQGNPVAIDGKRLSPAAMVKELNRLGGKHGVGRLDMVENRMVGMKSRGVYETPGGTIIHAAHRDLEGLCMDRETMHLRDSLLPKYAECVYYGFWFAPEREALQAFIDKTQERITGTVQVKLYKGNVVPLSRTSPYSLYSEEMVTFEEDHVYDQKDATGFIRLQSLRLRGYKRDVKTSGKA
ncbi:MAG: argininosuccinate synthase [Desulfovibrionaceae bacterium]